MGAERIEEALAQVKHRGQVGSVPFLTVGFPDIETTLELVATLAEAGATVIELGVPFSDPVADGETIQRANSHALQQRVTLYKCLEVCADLRQRGIEVPLVLMGYYNPIYTYGLECFVEDAATAGVDGLIVPDLPSEEADPLIQACAKRGLGVIPLLAPTSTEDRVASACQGARGFVYCITLTGVTGAREALPSGATNLVRIVRRHTDLAIAVGFGVSRQAHVQALGQVADAVVFGSALIRIIEETPREQVVTAVQEFVETLVGIPKPV